jgi:hypothetical protein
MHAVFFPVAGGSTLASSDQLQTLRSAYCTYQKTHRMACWSTLAICGSGGVRSNAAIRFLGAAGVCRKPAPSVTAARSEGISDAAPSTRPKLYAVECNTNRSTLGPAIHSPSQSHSHLCSHPSVAYAAMACKQPLCTRDHKNKHRKRLRCHLQLLPWTAFSAFSRRMYDIGNITETRTLIYLYPLQSRSG